MIQKLTVVSEMHIWSSNSGVALYELVKNKKCHLYHFRYQQHNKNFCRIFYTLNLTRKRQKSRAGVRRQWCRLCR